MKNEEGLGRAVTYTIPLDPLDDALFASASWKECSSGELY
jgi:hypothetical protein